jgi:hypothetical protein
VKYWFSSLFTRDETIMPDLDAEIHGYRISNQPEYVSMGYVEKDVKSHLQADISTLFMDYISKVNFVIGLNDMDTSRHRLIYHCDLFHFRRTV